MSGWEDAPSNGWEDAPLSREESEALASSGMKEAGKLGANLVTGLASPFFGVGAFASAPSGKRMESFKEGMDAFQEKTRLPYKNPKGGAAKAEENVSKGLEWLTQRMVEAGMLAKDTVGTIAGIRQKQQGDLIKAIPDEVAGLVGEIGGQLLPLPPAAKLGRMGTNKMRELFNKSISPEEQAAINAATQQPVNTFPILDEQAPAMPPGHTATNVPQPFPVLDERVPMLPEQGAPANTPFPALNEVAPREPVQAAGFPKLEEPNVPPDAPRPLDITPDDRAIPHQPNPQFENILPAKESLLPEQNLFDALLNKDADAQRIKDMESNTQTEALRNTIPSVDFPLRQEVLEQPAIKQAIDNFRREAERLKDMPEQLAKLQEEFAAGMRMLGIDKASDAYGRPLYEGGKGGTTLPIERSLTLKEQAKAGESTPGSDFARANKMPDNPLGTRNKMGRFVPKSQRGMVDPKVLTEGLRNIKKRLGQLRGILKDENGDGVVVFRGNHSMKDGATYDPRTRRMSTRDGEHDPYAVFVSDNPYLSSAYASVGQRFPGSADIVPFHHASGGKVVPFIFRDDVIIKEFPVRRGSFNKFEFDRQARLLGKNEVLVARNGYESGPADLYEDHANKATYANDQYAFTDPSVVKHLYESLPELEGPLGQTAKGASQRGGRKVDPEFVKFKNRLPENFKGKAAYLWRIHQEQQAAKNQVEGIPGQNKENVIAQIDGLHKVVEEVAPIGEKSFEEMKPHILASPDTKMGMWGRAWRTGLQLTGFEKKNVLLRYVGDIVNNAVRAYEVASKNLLKDPKTGVITKIEALPLKDRTIVREAMRAMEGKEGTLDTSLWTDNMKEAYTTYRKAMDDGFAFMNDVRKTLGMKPVPYRHNYLPSRWEGDFLIPVLDKEGTMVHILTTSSKLGANKAREAMQKLHPDFTFGDVEYRSIRQHSKDLEASQRDVMSILAEDDPRMPAIQSAFEELLSQQTYGTQNFKKHFEAKRKEAMGGFQGGKEWLTPEQNAKEGFQSDMRYLEQLYKWGELQKAGQKINKILSDPEIKKSQKNALLFAKNYWEGVSGHGTQAQRILDGVLDLFGEHTGIGSSNIKDTGRVLKTAMTISFLGLGNIAYMGSQAWQPIQMKPAWMEYLRSKGAKGVWAISDAKAELDSVAPMKMKSEFGQEASKWAHDNHIADSYILDDISDAGSGKYARSMENMVQYLTPAKIEIYSRYNAFLSYAHYLNDSGVPKMQAFESAAKMVDMSMTNYHLHERPMLYRNLGFVGDMASSFTSFKHNQWQQLSAFGKKGHRSGLAPLIGMQLVSGGLMGLYARDEIDALIKGLNKTGMFEDYIPTTREYLLRQGWNDGVVFGGVSFITGMDMSSKFSAADVLPNGPVEAFLPFYNDWAKKFDSLVEMASRRSDESVRQAAHAWAPTSMKWTLEDPIAFGEKNGEVMSNPATDVGLAKRGTGDRLARVAGAYSLKEARERFGLMEEKNQSKWQADRSASILRKAKDLEPDDKGMVELGRQYARLGGDTKEIEQALDAHQKAKFMTAFEQERGNALTTDRQNLKAKRMQGYERK